MVCDFGLLVGWLLFFVVVSIGFGFALFVLIVCLWFVFLICYIVVVLWWDWCICIFDMLLMGGVGWWCWVVWGLVMWVG